MKSLASTKWPGVQYTDDNDVENDDNANTNDNDNDTSQLHIFTWLFAK